MADPANPSLLYAGVFGAVVAPFGVFESPDGGESWFLLGKGLPAVVTIALALDPARHVLYAGTQGSGAWALSLR